MSTWTNVHISDGTSHKERLQDEVKLLKFHCEELQRKLDSARRELANIPAAAREWGYVEISDENGMVRLAVVAHEVEREALKGKS